MTRALTTAAIASIAFMVILALAAAAVRTGIVGEDALRLWAGASTAADGDVSLGRIVAAYPTLPFLTTTLIAWIAPAGTPAPSLVAAALLALVAGSCFLSFRKAGLPDWTAVLATLLVAFHPALLRAAISGPADMYLAAFLLIFSLALYDLRAHSGTTEVMGVGLSLLALAFSHPMGVAIAFTAVPLLAFAVSPVLVANSALNVVLALIFPTIFSIGAFAYVSWIFPGAGWSFFVAPAESLLTWTTDVARVFGDGFSGSLALDAGLAMMSALAVGAPVAAVLVTLVRRRRPLVTPALVLAAIMIAATVIGVGSRLFGDPAVIVAAAPILAATVVMRVPVARERLALTMLLLVIGWFGGIVSLALVDPTTIKHVTAAVAGGGDERERLDALDAGGAAIGREGILADTDNAAAFVLGRGRARGIFGSASEPFALALLFVRIDTPFVAVPDPQSSAGANDRLNKAFPALFRQGKPGYSVVYQNNTWRLFGRLRDVVDLKD